MKKTILALMLFVLTVTSVFAIDYRYPAGGPTTTSDSNVREVTLTGENSSINYSPTSAVIGLDNQTALTATLIPGNEYSVSVTWGTFGGNYSNAGSVWIDWDQDESYATTELVGSWTGTPTVTESYTFTVPAEFTGSTRIRVMQRESGSLPLDPAGSYSWGSNMDFTISEYIAGAPDVPTLVSPAHGATNVAIDTNLEWTTGESTDHAVLYIADNAEFNDATLENPATSPYTTSLNNGTTYFWKVVAVSASAIEMSSVVNTFTTEFGAVSEFPWFEDFEDDDLDWTIIDNNEDGDMWVTNYTLNTYQGSQVANINTDFNAGNNDDYLITPQLTLTGNERLKFWYRVHSAGEPNDFQVVLSTTGIDPEDFTETVLPLAVYSNTTYQEQIVDISAYSGNCYLAFHVPAGGLDGWRIYIDNVTVEEIPATPIVEINTDPIDFGSLALNESSDSEIVSIQNIGGGILNINDVSIIGTDADQFDYTATEDYALAATEELLVSVIFTPTSDGEKTATLQITDDLTREVYEIALSGIGIDTNIYEINIPYTQDFETEEAFVGWTSVADSDNSYSVSERVASSAHTGSYSHKFYHSSSATYSNLELISPVVVPDMDAFRVRFWAKKSNISNSDPLLVGKYNQAMDVFTVIDTLDLTTSYVEYTVEMVSPARANERIAFKGSYTSSYQYIYIDDITFEEAPEGALVEITPDAHDFGEIFIAGSKTETFTVANNGVIAADITEITVPAGYSFETELSFPYSLEAGASFAVNVTFAPMAEMIYSGNLRVKEAAGFTPINHDVPLTGSGIPVPQGDNHNNPFILTLADSVTVTGSTTDFQTYYSFCSSQSVVYQLTLPTDKLMSVSLDGTAWDTKLWIFNSFQQIDDATSATTADAWYYNDDQTSASTGGDRAKARDRATWSEMLETYTPEGVYYILVSGYNANNGEYTLTVETADIPLPSAVTNPSPANEAIDQPTSLTLSWTNPEYTDNVDLYFGTPDNMTLILDNVIAVEEHQVTDLDPSTVYNWKVIARNISGDTPEVDVETWSFTSIGNAPDAVTYTAPADEATNRPITGNLTWSAATGANGYYVYLSTDETFAGVTPQDQTATTYAYSGLAYETTYYWKVIPYNVVGQATEGIEVWSFTTIPDPSLELPVIVTFDASTTMPAEIIANNMLISATHGNNSNGLYKNIYGSYPDAYAQFQVMRNVEADTELNFEYRIMAYSGYPGAAHTIIEDEYIRVKVSTDGGANYDTAYEINSANHVVSTDFANVSVPLGAYAGQYITVRLEARREAGDYYVDFDNFYFRVPPTTPLVDLSTEAIDFGQVVLGDTSDAETVTITNIGGGTLNISGIAINGTNAGDFAYSTADGASMALGFNESLTIDVTATPSASGALVASLDITDDMSRSVTSIALAASGYDATITGPFFNGLENDTDVLGWNVNLESTSTYATASRYSSSSSSHTGTYSFRVYCPSYASTSAELISPVITPDLNDYRVKFWAKGAGTLIVGKYNQAMDTFTAIDTISTLAEYSYNEYTVELTAARTNERIAFQFETSSTTYSSKYIYLDDLTFEEIPQNPIASLSASEIDFGVTFLNETSSEDVSITNVGAGTLNITAIEIYGPNADDFDYSTAPDASMALAADESLVITIDFTPTAEGLRDATLQITDDLGNRFRINSATKNTNNSRNLNFVTLSGDGYIPPQGSTCDNPLALELPAVDVTGDTADYGDDYSSTGITGSSISASYLNGDDVVYQFTVENDVLLNGSIVAGGTYLGAFILQDEPNADTPAQVTHALSAGSGYSVTYTNVEISAGTYYLILSTWPTPQSVTYTINLTATTVVADPEIPTNVNITADGTIVITWEAADNANSYNVYACDTPDGDYELLNDGSVSETSYTYTGTENMKFFKVKASSDVIETPAKGFRRQ